MAKEKFVLITASQEPNICVVSLGKINMLVKSNDGITNEIVEKIKEPLICGVSEHFDEEFEIQEINVTSTIPMMGNVRLRKVDPEIGEKDLVVEFAETWLYS